MTRPVTRTAALRSALVATALLALASGCGGSEEKEPRATPTAGATASDPATEPTEPTAEPSPSYAGPPATGEVLETSHYRFRAPKGWEHYPISGEFSQSFQDFRTGQSLSLGIIEQMNATTLDAAAGIVQENTTQSYPPKRVEDTTLGGLPAFRFAGKETDVRHGEIYGTLHDGALVTIKFSMQTDGDRGRAIIDSVLQTWEWK